MVKGVNGVKTEKSYIDFFSEMAERQITAREFFDCILLESIERHFGLDNLVFFYYNQTGDFLSWVRRDEVLLNSDNHPYNLFISNDVIRNMLFQEASRNKLTYFDIEPKLYKSTDIIAERDYQHSAYVRFIQENFDSYYSVSMAFGMNGYIQLSFLKQKEEGDFTTDEMTNLKEIYLYVANSYKNFKKYEHGKIISDIQNEIIASGEKAYLITDDFNNILGYNEHAESYLKEILGVLFHKKLSEDPSPNWLPILFEDKQSGAGDIRERILMNYILKIHTYNRTYSNGIIDKYYWIAISNCDEGSVNQYTVERLPLTVTEKKIARLMYEGLTYKAIAEELVVSYHTVKKHVQNIYIKCEVNSRYELYKRIEEQ